MFESVVASRSPRHGRGGGSSPTGNQPDRRGTPSLPPKTRTTPVARSGPARRRMPTVPETVEHCYQCATENRTSVSAKLQHPCYAIGVMCVTDPQNNFGNTSYKCLVRAAVLPEVYYLSAGQRLDMGLAAPRSTG